VRQAFPVAPLSARQPADGVRKIMAPLSWNDPIRCRRLEVDRDTSDAKEMSMTSQTRLTDELDALYAAYVESINDAVAGDDLALAAELAESYDRDAIMLMAEREGRQDLLSHFGLTQDGGRLSVERDTPLRRLVKSVASLRSA
jgi:hypothetical protein